MGGQGLVFLCINVLAVVLSQVEVGQAEPLPPMELYWKEVLPDTPMPDVVRAKLHPDTPADGTIKDNPVEAAITATLAYFHGYDNPNYQNLPRTMNFNLYFLKKDLQTGTKMKMMFTKSTSRPSFLPRSVAETLPFSSSKLSEILQFFSIDPNSEEAKLMMRTLLTCEMPAMKGEDKYCATSLDSMIDFAVSKLGTSDVSVHSTWVEKDSTWQIYTIAPGVQHIGSSNLVGCHYEAYKYAVHYCHEVVSTSAYIVPLVGEDGTRVNATVMCHDDTSEWNPKTDLVFKMKPGADQVCHFNPEGHLVWFKNNVLLLPAST